MSSNNAEIDFTTPEFLTCPYPLYDEARRARRVSRVAGQNSYLVTHHEDVRFAAQHTELFSSHRPSLGAGDAEFEAIAAEGYPEVATLVTNDPPEHTRFRRLLNRRFSARSVAQIEEPIRKIADELIDGFATQGAVEFLTEFAIPFPCRVFGEILGVSVGDQAKFKQWADAIADSTSTFISRERALECKRGIVELQHYFAREIERRRADPGDDLISELVMARTGDEKPLDVPEIIDVLRILLAGGVETTASVMSTAMYLLLTHPDQMAEVQDNHDLIPAMIEEALRFEAPVLWNPRIVEKEGVELGGCPIAVGSRVMIGWAAANRDPNHYGDDANRFDIHRAVSDHMAFGHGVHFCLGAGLGRAEARIAFEQLFTRLGNIRFAVPVEELAFSGAFLRRLRSLPLLFDHPTEAD